MRGSLRRRLIFALVVALAAGACSDSGQQVSGEGSRPLTAPTPSAGAVTRLVANEGGGSGRDGSLVVRLSEGRASDGESPPTVRRVDGLVLGDEEISAVLDRLPPWDIDDSDEADFNRPAESLPPPRTGRTVDQPFPAGPDLAAPVTAAGPLEVLRAQPEGEVGIAPFISITFNQPMAPLATVGRLDDLDVPVKITPPLPGRWQWIGTRTLRFEHDPQIFDRLPMATSYTVEVPAGTESQTGGELAETFRFEFETPPPSVVRLIPDYGPLGLKQVFLAVFDQRVEPAAVLEAITLLADGEERGLRLASAAEIEADEYISNRVGWELEGTWVAFRPVLPLEPDSAIKITVGPHVPSAEGPNTSGRSSSAEAWTYAPLRVERTNCSRWSCRPGSHLEAYFNNPLDAATVDAADISVTPELPGAVVSVFYDSISIDGPTMGGAVYKVVIPAAVGDVFGQTLGEPETVEFEIDEATPLIWSMGGGFVTVDPLGARQTVPVIVRQWEELRVRLYTVEPDDFPSYLDFMSRIRSRPTPTVSGAPWPLAADRTVRTGIRDDALTEVPIDLSGVLGGRHGHLVMVVEGAGRLAETADPYRSGGVVTWVQDTDIGVDLVEDGLDVVLWTTDLRSGDPLAGVEIRLGDRDPPLVTDADGLARAATGADGFDGIVASLGDDRALSPVRAWESLEDQMIWYTADDRGMYRPGETLHLKGWVRHLDLTGDGDLEFLPPGQQISYRAVGPSGNELGSGEVRIDEHGGFDLAIALSEGANLGWGRIEFGRPVAAGDGEPSRPEEHLDAGVGVVRPSSAADVVAHTHTFEVQEFRRPEFEVEARVESAGPHFIDEPAVVAVDARYFSGGALPNAEVNWWVTTRRGSYAPPNWSDFSFGVWRPWWHYYEDWYWSSESEEFTGTTGADGSHYLRIDIEDDGEALPVAVTAEVAVVDVNRQGWSSSTDFLVHSADLYVGLRSSRAFVRAGDGIDIEAVVTDLDGNPVAGRPFEMTAERLVWRHVDGKWVEVALDSETCEPVSGPAPVACEFAAGAGGRYRIAARVVDDSGRANRSELTRWVSGAKEGVPRRSVELEDVELVPDSETYASGDTAEILVGSPFASATGLLTVVHSRIIETRTFEVTDHAAVLEVPITDGHVPELKLRVDLAAVTARTADDGAVLTGVPARPAHASGEILLRVPPVQRTLEVVATPASAVLQPGAPTSVAVEVNDAAGEPVEGANVLLIVVDEAVLALSGYELIDPIEVFYRQRAAVLSAVRGRDTILLENPQGLDDEIEDEIEVEDFAAETRAQADAAVSAAAAAAGAGSGLLVAVREDLDALALFDPDAVTDAAGRVIVEFDLPDNLTRYRVMAVAVHGADRFGAGESAITARLPLQVRPSAPRFLNYGDRFELPVVVH
ncbi:MAG: MG2 domain-containing protein, partial [bacterium]|nr:MG2 domain-containing protein [bacterium]